MKGSPIGRTRISTGLDGFVISTITSCEFAVPPGFTERNAKCRLPTRPSLTVCTPLLVLVAANRLSCIGAAGSVRSKMTIEPLFRSVATTRSAPSSEICTSPSVVAKLRTTESRSTGVAPEPSQMKSALPGAVRKLHVVV
jgi:hypothetical protein